MGYKIVIDYKTGDSFGSHEETTELEYGWTNLNRVKECLLRIKNHYKFYEDNGDSMYMKKTTKKNCQWALHIYENTIF